MAVVDADHELAKVLLAHLVRKKTPSVEKIEQLASLAELEHKHVCRLKKKNHTRGKKTRD